MTSEEIKNVIQEILSSGKMHFTTSNFDLLYKESDIVDGAKIDGKLNNLGGLAESALKLLTEAHPEMSLHTIILNIKVENDSELLMEHISLLDSFFGSLSKDVIPKWNIIDEAAIPDEIQVCVIGGFKL